MAFSPIPIIHGSMGFIRTSQAVAFDLWINAILYILVLLVIFGFQVKDLTLQLIHYTKIIILILVEIFLLIPFTIIRIIYYIYNTINGLRTDDTRYNINGIIRTATIHQLFWQQEEEHNYLVMTSLFQRGPNIFLEVQENIPLLNNIVENSLIEDFNQPPPVSNDDTSVVTFESTHSNFFKNIAFKKHNPSKSSIDNGNNASILKSKNKSKPTSATIVN
ncbi:unnamed protein product [Candida verbasci]|uniref:Uncharacterized protein n=1 Tax=Candida verbasci TaxID=1227364 RepID=A0A9W4TUR3_9ASCO|nr:unnamed protein product [Candida verbasci]